MPDTGALARARVRARKCMNNELTGRAAATRAGAGAAGSRQLFALARPHQFRTIPLRLKLFSGARQMDTDFYLYTHEHTHTLEWLTCGNLKILLPLPPPPPKPTEIN